MNKYIYILFISFYLLSCIKSDNKESRLHNDTVHLIEYFDDGLIKSKYTTVDGVNDGQYIRFYPNGKIRYQLSYIQGELNGLFLLYYKNGVIKKRGSLCLGKYVGLIECWDDEGRLDSICEYILVYPTGMETIKDFLSSEDIYNVDNAEEKFSYLNSLIVYDDKQKILPNKTFIAQVMLEKDTITLGDSILINVNFSYQGSEKYLPFEIYFEDEMLSDSLLIRISPDRKQKQKETVFSIIGRRRGDNIFQGYVLVHGDKGDYALYFKELYYVK